MLKNSLFTVLLASLVCGCASTYKPLEPSRLTYQMPRHLNDSVLVSYIYDVQELTGNRRYARKEKIRGMISVAVRIENRSSSALMISKENFKVYSADRESAFYTPLEYSKKVKQRVGAHLLHALYGPWALSWETNNKGETDYDFIYIPVGAIIGIGNAIRAGTANKANFETAEKYELWNKTVEPGGVLSGLIFIPYNNYQPLSFSYEELNP